MKWIPCTLIAALCAALSASAAESQLRLAHDKKTESGWARVNRSLYLMGTQLEVQIDGPSRKVALEASEAVFRAVATAERRLSTWRGDSELAQMNLAAPERELILSPLLLRDLKAVFFWARATGYHFTPAIGPLVFAWDLRNAGRHPQPQELQAAIAASRPDAFAITPRGIFKKNAAARIEEGGFAKGIGLDDALAAIKDLPIGDVMLDFGGQVSVKSHKSIPVSIANPLDRDDLLLEVSVASGSVATSNNSEHSRQVGGEHFGHILDPINGRPSPYKGSVTVIAASGMAADCLSTGLFVMGAAEGMRFVKGQQGSDSEPIDVIFVEKVNSSKDAWVARASCGIKGRLRALKQNVTIEYNCLPAALAPHSPEKHS